MRKFILYRDTDVTGVSGTGIVAEGVVFSNGKTVVQWVVGEHQSTVVWDAFDDVEAIHGHGGATRVVDKDVLDYLSFSEWLDSQGLIVSDQTPDADTRTHEDLANEFIAEHDK